MLPSTLSAGSLSRSAVAKRRPPLAKQLSLQPRGSRNQVHLPLGRIAIVPCQAIQRHFAHQIRINLMLVAPLAPANDLVVDPAPSGSDDLQQPRSGRLVLLALGRDRVAYGVTGDWPGL